MVLFKRKDGGGIELFGNSELLVLFCSLVFMEMVIEQFASGRWLGWPKDREDIVSSGETREEVIQNLKELYIAVIEYETIMKDRRVIIQPVVYTQNNG